jgi:hypothetical protein
MGDVVRDVVTGFTGRVVAHVRYVTGCDQFCVQPSCKEDGSPVDGKYFDVNRLHLITADAKTGNPLRDLVRAVEATKMPNSIRQSVTRFGGPSDNEPSVK